LRDAGRFDEAATELESWIHEDPRNRSYRRSLVDTYLAAKRFDDAWRAAQEWYDRTDGEDWEALVEVLAANHQYDRAEQLLLDWLHDDPDNDEWQLALIDTLIAAGRIDDALEIVQTNLPHGRARLQYEGAAIRAYEIGGRHDEAMRLIRQWIQRVERGLIDTPPFLLVELRTQFLIPQLLLEGRFDDARSRLQRWFEEADDPRDKVSYLKTLSECERRSGNPDAAVETMQLAYDLNPLDEDTCNSLGYTWADAGLNLDRAEELIRQAVARNPRASAYLDSLGWVRYKKRDFAEAKRWLTLALGGDLRDDPVIHDHMGDTFWHLGDVDQALAHWRAAVKAVRQAKGPDMDPTWRTIREQTPRKIEAAEQGRTPPVAPTGPSAGEDVTPGPTKPMPREDVEPLDAPIA
jgi:tetratricopeptide (TPR) repeat protein